MEKVIPILIALAIFAIQAYKKYQEEQVKAAKRKANMPQPLPVEIQEPKSNWIDKYEAEKEARLNPLSEVQRVQAQKAKKLKAQHAAIQPKLELIELEAPLAFDLKTAIIQEAILNRPRY